MRTDRNQAFDLRRQGKSYNEISKDLDIPKSTLCSWFKDNSWSSEIKQNLTEKVRVLNSKSMRNKKQIHVMHVINKRRWEMRHEQYRDKARNEFPGLKDNITFIAGLMLYWGEGDKTLKNGIVRIVNSDPEIIKTFYSFLRFLGIEKGRICVKLTIYPDLSDQSLKVFWSKTLDIPLNQFRKSTTILGRHPTRRMSYGVCSMEVYSRELKEKIFMWLRLSSEYINNSDIMRYNS